MRPKNADRMANSVDADQTAPDLGLHCLFRSVCPKTYDHYGKYHTYVDLGYPVIVGIVPNAELPLKCNLFSNNCHPFSTVF